MRGDAPYPHQQPGLTRSCELLRQREPVHGRVQHLAPRWPAGHLQQPNLNQQHSLEIQWNMVKSSQHGVCPWPILCSCSCPSHSITYSTQAPNASLINWPGTIQILGGREKHRVKSNSRRKGQFVSFSNSAQYLFTVWVFNSPCKSK